MSSSLRVGVSSSIGLITAKHIFLFNFALSSRNPTVENLLPLIFGNAHIQIQNNWIGSAVTATVPWMVDILS